MPLGFMSHYDTSIYDKEEFIEIWPEISEIGIEVSEEILEEMQDDTVLIPGSNSTVLTYLKGCLFILGFSMVDKGNDPASYDAYTSEAVLKTKSAMSNMGIEVEVIDNVNKDFIFKLKKLFEISDEKMISRLWEVLRINRDKTPEIVQSKEMSDASGKAVSKEETKVKQQASSFSNQVQAPPSSVTKGVGAVPGINFPKDSSTARMSIQYSLNKDGEKNLSPNFKVKDFRCKDGSDIILINPHLVQLLEKIQAHFGKNIRITSGYRTPSYNRTRKGAAKNSQHMYGNAADIQIDGVQPAEIHAWLKDWHKGGLGIYPKFIHVDVRDVVGEKEFARWDNRAKQKQLLA